jgi:hypothetical protein
MTRLDRHARLRIDGGLRSWHGALFFFPKIGVVLFELKDVLFGFACF